MSEMNYNIDLDKNIIFSDYDGCWPAMDILKRIGIVRSDPKFRKGLNTIIDFSKAEIPQGYLEADSIVEFVQDNLGFYKNIKIAFITGEQSVVGVGVFESILGLSNLQVFSKSFTQRDEAEEWLLE